MPSSLKRLAHLHLPNPIPYAHSLRLQEAVLSRHWSYRDTLKLPSSPHSPSSPTNPLPPPPPTLLTFSTHPTYTVGRRHLTSHPISASQVAFLTGTDSSNAISPASFHPSPRGGLLTYHSPGQLTAYPIVDLRLFSLSARAYISLLESAVINTCAALNVPHVGRSCGDPGVWILDKNTGKVSDKKLCAIGVRITRGVGSHGVGLNVHDAVIPPSLRGPYNFQDAEGNSLPSPAGEDPRGYLSWGFGRIVACGLEGKRTTWLTKEGADAGVQVGEVAGVFARELVKALNAAGKAENRQLLEGLDEVTEREVLDHDPQS